MSNDSPKQHPDASASCTAPSFKFGKDLRLLNSADFTCVFNNAPLRASHPSLLILARKTSDAQPRLGLVIPKKHVKRAVKRNQIKRIGRETFRLQQHKLPPIDAIVLARRGADTLSPEELHKIFNGLWKRISKHANA